MDQKLTQRIIGAIILTALAVIFVPMLFDEPVEEPGPVRELELPEFPPDFQAGLAPKTELGGEPEQFIVEDSGAGALTETEMGEEAPAYQPPAPVRPAPTETPRPQVASPPPATKPAPAITKPPAPAAPSPKPAALGGWVIQVGSFSKEINALSFRDKLRKGGYSAFVEPATGQGQGTLFRVRVGPEADKRRAESMRDKIAADFGVKAYVTTGQ